MSSIVVRSVEIEASPEVVFDFVQNGARRHEWDERVVRATLLDADRPGQGARLVIEALAYGKRTFATELRYLSFDRPVRTVVKIERITGPTLLSGGGGAWTYEAVPAGTRFTTRFSYDVKGGAFGRLLDRIWLKGFLERLTDKSLRNLKRLVEK